MLKKNYISIIFVNWTPLIINQYNIALDHLKNRCPHLFFLSNEDRMQTGDASATDWTLGFRRDPTNFRPRINKYGSIKDREQKASGNFFLMED